MGGGDNSVMMINQSLFEGTGIPWKPASMSTEPPQGSSRKKPIDAVRSNPVEERPRVATTYQRGNAGVLRYWSSQARTGEAYVPGVEPDQLPGDEADRARAIKDGSRYSALKLGTEGPRSDFAAHDDDVISVNEERERPRTRGIPGYQGLRSGRFSAAPTEPQCWHGSHRPRTAMPAFSTGEPDLGLHFPKKAAPLGYPTSGRTPRGHTPELYGAGATPRDPGRPRAPARHDVAAIEAQRAARDEQAARGATPDYWEDGHRLPKPPATGSASAAGAAAAEGASGSNTPPSLGGEYAGARGAREDATRASLEAMAHADRVADTIRSNEVHPSPLLVAAARRRAFAEHIPHPEDSLHVLGPEDSQVAREERRRGVLPVDPYRSQVRGRLVTGYGGSRNLVPPGNPPFKTDPNEGLQRRKLNLGF
ncbi:unnamed protein product [Pedinophyceae sp. YPF-701]|nr:unnamed protein product [Pedinophyceae sp. YPF-701]